MVAVVCVGVGCEMILPESMATLLRDLAESQPTVMPAVPRVFEKVHAKILAGVETAGTARKHAFRVALAVGQRVSAERQRDCLSFSMNWLTGQSLRGSML